MSSQEQLFRQEALSAITSREGSPVKPLGISNWTLSIFLFALISTVCAFLGVARYARTETVPGQLVPTGGALDVVPLRPGVVTRVYVSEGQIVQVGAPIVAVGTDQAFSAGQSLGAELLASANTQASAADAQRAAHLASLSSQMDEVEAQLDELRGQEDYLKLAISRQAARLKLNLETAQAARTLYEQQLTSAIQLRQREEALLASEQSLSDLQEKLDSFPKTIRRLDAQRGRLLAERSEANAAALITKAQIADRQRQVAAEASTVLKASAAGQIASLPARLGMSVSAGLPVATIVPATPQLEAELWIPSRAIGHLGPGKTARLMYDAFPYATYGTWQATIVAIDKVPTPPQFLPIPIKTEESLYRVRAKLSSQGIRTARQYSPLKSGMRLSADMVLEEKPIAGWIIDKFFAAAKRGTEARRS